MCQTPFVLAQRAATEVPRWTRAEIGVAYVWVFDPRTQRAWTYTRQEIREVTDGVLRTANPDIAVPFAEIFKA